MKFRMIFLGAEQDPDGGTVPELDADIPVDESSLRCYEYSGTHMVRRDQLANGRVRRTPVANFRARIVSDIIRDDGAQQQREFGVEAELGGAAKSLPCRQRSSAGWAVTWPSCAYNSAPGVPLNVTCTPASCLGNLRPFAPGYSPPGAR